MAYYTPGTPATANTLARAENIATELTTIETSFDKIPEQLSLEQGRAVGFRVRLLETAGRSARVALRSFREVASAKKVDFLGTLLDDCDVKGDRISVELKANQWIEVEAMWK